MKKLSKYKRLELRFLKEEYRMEKEKLMHPTPSTKIPFRDIKDHADLMEAFENLTRLLCRREIYGEEQIENIAYWKSEIAHFLRIQSAQPGVAAEGGEGPFEKSGAVPDNEVRKHSNNPHL